MNSHSHSPREQFSPPSSAPIIIRPRLYSEEEKAPPRQQRARSQRSSSSNVLESNSRRRPRTHRSKHGSSEERKEFLSCHSEGSGEDEEQIEAASEEKDRLTRIIASISHTPSLTRVASAKHIQSSSMTRTKPRSSSTGTTSASDEEESNDNDDDSGDVSRPIVSLATQKAAMDYPTIAVTPSMLAHSQPAPFTPMLLHQMTPTTGQSSPSPLHQPQPLPSLQSQSLQPAQPRKSSATATSPQSLSRSSTRLSTPRPVSPPLDPDTFTAKTWHLRSAECLLAATSAVDECCRAIVATNQSFHHGSSLSVETRRLALTVAVFERSLYAYALRISSSRQSQTATVSNSSSTANTPTLMPSQPFMPQQESELGLPIISDRTLSGSGGWEHSSHPVSYEHTIPSSTAHSLVSSAMSITSKPPIHTSSNGSKHMNVANGKMSRASTRSLTDTNSSTRSLPQFSPQSSVFGTTLSHSPSSGAIPPTIPAPKSRMGDTGQYFIPNAVAMPPLDPSSIPTVSLPSQRSRASSSQQPPVLAQPSSLLHAATAMPSQTQSLPPQSPRSVSPLDPAMLSSPQIGAMNGNGRSPGSATRSLRQVSPVNSQPSSSNGRMNWHQPAGMSCLLKILTNQLLETRSILLATNEDCSSFFRYVHHLIAKSFNVPLTSVKHLAKHPKGSITTVAIVALLSAMLSTRPAQRLGSLTSAALKELLGKLESRAMKFSESETADFLLSFIPPSFQSSFITLSVILAPHTVAAQLKSAIHTRAAFTIIPLFLYTVYRVSLYRRVQRLKKLHSRLGLLLRLWHICFSLLDQHQQRLGVAANIDGDSDTDRQSVSGEGLLANAEPARVPISRWLLQLVPPELDASFWYHRSWRLSLIKYGMDVLYCSINNWTKTFGLQMRLVTVPYLVTVALYYASQPHFAASTASRLMSSPDINVVKRAWMMLDNPMARKFVLGVLPKMGKSQGFCVCQEIELCDYDDEFRARGVNPALTAEEESAFDFNYNTNTKKAVKILSASTLPYSSRHRRPYKHSRLISSRLRESLSSLDDENDCHSLTEPTLKLLLLSSKPINLTINLRFHRVPSLSHVRSPRSQSSPVIIYFHGGGWIGDFRASHLHFLSQWTNELSIPILYINYSAAPENPYPTALNECYDVYRWVVEGRLGLNASQIVLVGDSTGGNLAAACCMKAIIDKIRIPDAVLLACPILNLRLTPTPSRSLYMTDPVLPMNLLLQLRSLYLPPIQQFISTGNGNHTQSLSLHSEVDSDPCLSPIVASDFLLKQWPTTGIMVGSYDPFVDDSVDFAHRLTENGVNVKLKIYDEAPHSLWDFAPLLQESQHAVKLTAQWIRQACEQKQAEEEQRERDELED